MVEQLTRLDPATAGTRIMQALVVKQGLKASKIGLKLNTTYTKKNLLRTASAITGFHYPIRGSAGVDTAIADLEQWLKEARGARELLESCENNRWPT